MRNLIIIFLIFFSFDSFSQNGFNKTYYIYSPLSSICTNIIKIDTSYFVTGGTFLEINPNIQGFYFLNLNNNGDTSNLHVLNDTNYFYWGGLVGNAIKLSSNNIYQAVSVFKLDTSPILIQVLLFKFKNCDTLWTNTCISDTMEREVFDFTYLDGYYYITGAIEFPGYTYYDIMLLKTDSLGHLIWMKHFGNDKAMGYQIISTFDHKIMVAAHYYNYLGTNQSQWYIMKLDTAGNIIWTHDYGNPTLNDYPPKYMIETSDSNYVITGQYGMVHKYADLSNPDALKKGRFLKINPNGTILVDKIYGSITDFTCMGIIKEKSNKNFITTFNGGTPYYVQSPYNPILMELTPEGNILWFRYYYYNNNTAADQAMVESLEFTPDGGYIFAGFGTDISITPAQRGWIVKTDSLGFDGFSTMGIDTAYRIEHVSDTCYGDTAVVYTHLFGITAPYSISYEGFANHNNLYYSPELTYSEKGIADSLIITSPMLTGNDSLIDIICHITDGIGRTLTDTIQVNVACLVNVITPVSWENSIHIYPNPAGNNLTVEISNNQLQITNVMILDLTGKQVKQVKFKGQNKKYIINIKDLPLGLYFVDIQTDNGAVVRKFVKQ